MAGKSEVVVRFLGDTKNIEAALGRMDRGLDKTGTTAAHVGDKVDTSGRKFSKLGGVLAGLAGTAAIFTGAAVVVGGALMEAARAGAEEQKSSALLDQTLKSVTHSTQQQTTSVEDWISTTARATGVMDDQLRPALAQLVRSTKDTSQAQDLLNLALDISAGTGKDLQTVSVALSKAYVGNTQGLTRLGISMKDSKGHALSFKDAVAALSTEFAGQSNTAANTYDGKMKRLDVAMNQLKESIGVKLLPIMEKFADWMVNTGVPWLQNTADELSKFLTPAIDSASKSFDDMGKTVKDNQPFFDDLSTVILPLLKSGMTQFAFTIGLVSDALKALGTAGSWVESGLQGWETAGEKVTTTFAAIANAVQVAVNAVRTLWNSTIGGKGLHIPGIPLTTFTGADFTIPKLARGGIVSSPTLALIGEAGPEAVVPLGRGGLGGGDTHVHIHGGVFTGSPMEVARQLHGLMRNAQGSGINFGIPA